MPRLHALSMQPTLLLSTPVWLANCTFVGSGGDLLPAHGEREVLYF
jgi:hypothetical protein